MSVLVLGGDRVSSLKTYIEELGISRIVHWTGRGMKTGKIHLRPLPSDTRVMVMMTRYLNHNAMRHYRAVAKARGVKLIYADRGLEHVRAALKQTVTEIKTKESV